MKKPSAGRWDGVYKAVFLLSLFALGLFFGAAGIRYGWPGFEPLKAGLDSGKDFLKAWRVKTEPLSPIDPYIARFKTYWDPKHAYNGYTLITLYSEDAYLIDMEGKVVRRWHLPFHKAWPNPTHVTHWPTSYLEIDRARLLPNGDIIALYTAPGNTPYGYGLAKFDKDGNPLWTYDANTHHDFYIAKNGDIYALVQEVIYDPVPGMEQIPYPQLADFLVVLTPDGKEKERISLLEAFARSKYKAIVTHFRPHNREQVWDRLHPNSVERLEAGQAKAFPMFREGQVLISVRNINTIAMLDMQEKRIVWAARGDWMEQHAAYFMDNGAIIMFDNRGLRRRNMLVSRALAFDPRTSRITWEFRGDRHNTIYSVITGRVEPLRNGNVLIAETRGARIWEVTPDGKVAWKYAYKGYSYRAHVLSAIRYSREELPFLESASGSRGETRVPAGRERP